MIRVGHQKWREMSVVFIILTKKISNVIIDKINLSQVKLNIEMINSYILSLFGYWTI